MPGLMNTNGDNKPAGHSPATATLRIGSLTLPHATLLAPMAGYSDYIFRSAVRSLGGLGLAFSEMIDPRSLLHGKSRKRDAILKTDPTDVPLGYQIYGTDCRIMCEGARWLVDHGAPLIDINMGCPQKQISGRGAGAGMLRNPDNAVRLAAAVVASVAVPVTVKLRLGWDSTCIVAPRMAADLEQVGVAAITIHGRTCQQGYAGHADWDLIRRIVSRTDKIPVIGNGDIWTGADASAMVRQTGCAGVMMGRGAIKNPWLMRDAAAALNGNPIPPPPSDRERLEFMRRHFESTTAEFGERVGSLLFRRWIPEYSKELGIDRRVMVELLKETDVHTLRDWMDSAVQKLAGT